MRASRRMATGTAEQAAILRDAPQRCGAPQDEVRDLWRTPVRDETPSSPPQINLDHPLVLRDLIDRALRDDGALVQHRHLDPEFAHEGHVVLHHHDGTLAVDLPQQLRGLVCLGIGHAGDRLIDKQELRFLGEQHADFEPLFLPVGEAPGEARAQRAEPYGLEQAIDARLLVEARAPPQTDAGAAARLSTPPPVTPPPPTLATPAAAVSLRPPTL